MIKNKKNKNEISSFYSIQSSLFIIYLSSLVFTYFIYGFISCQFRVFDFTGENAPVEHPSLFVLIAIILFIIFCVIFYFDRKRISVLILHFFSFLLFSFIFIQINKNRWFEYENALYIISFILLLSFYFAWLISKIKSDRIISFIDRKAFIILIIISIIYLFYFSFLAMERHNRFFSQLYDLGWEHQVIYNISKTGIPYSTIESEKGIINWADHTSFIYYLLAPFYKLFPSVNFLFIAQIISVVMSGFFIFFLCKKIFKNNLLSLITGLIFLFHPSVQGMLLEDFHPAVFAFPLFFLLFLFVENKNFTGVFVTAVILCLVREEFIFFALFIYIFLFFNEKIDLKKTLTGLITIICLAFISYRIMKLCGGGISDYERFYFFTNKFWGIIANILSYFLNYFMLNLLDST